MTRPSVCLMLSKFRGEAASHLRAVPAFMRVTGMGWLTSCAIEAASGPTVAIRLACASFDLCIEGPPFSLAQGILGLLSFGQIKREGDALVSNFAEIRSASLGVTFRPMAKSPRVKGTPSSTLAHCARNPYTKRLRRTRYASVRTGNGDRRQGCKRRPCWGRRRSSRR